MGYKELPLPAEVTIENTEALHADVKTALKGGYQDGVCFNANLTEIMTAPGIQLLLSVNNTLQTQGIPMRLANANDMLEQCFRQLGFYEQFQKWTQASA